MKKKLKVQKAFSGKMMRAATAQGRRVINPVKPGVQQPGFVPPRDPNMYSTTPPRPGMSTPFGPRPGVQPGGPPRDPNFFSTTPPRPGMFPSTIVNPIGPRQIQQPGGPPRDPNMFSTTPPRPDIQFGVQPLPAAPSAAPRPYLQHDLPKNFEPGMQLPAPDIIQPAPSGFGGLAEYALRQKNAPGGMAQPVPAMKRGGSVIARGNKLARSKPTKMF